MRRHSIAGICISQPPVLCLTLGTGPQFVAVLAVLHLCLLRYFPCTNLVDRADNYYTSLVFTGPDPQFVFNGPGRQLYLPTLAPNLYLPTLAPNFYLRALVNPEPGLAYTNLIPQICIYWPCPTIFITMLWICIYLLIYSGSSGYSNISNSSNFLGLENTNISMPILVN